MQLQITLNNDTTLEQIRKLAAFLTDFYALAPDANPLDAYRAEIEAIKSEREMQTTDAPGFVADADAPQVEVSFANVDPATLGFGSITVSTDADIAQSAAESVAHAASVPPPPAATTPEGYLDSKGLPWDIRIHTSNRSKVKDGSWKYKPRVEPALIEQVEAEARRILAIPALAAVPPPPPAAVTDGPDHGKDFPTLMQYVANEMAMLRLSVAEIEAIARAMGLTTPQGKGIFAYLSTRPELVRDAYERILALQANRQ